MDLRHDTGISQHVAAGLLAWAESNSGAEGFICPRSGGAYRIGRKPGIFVVSTTSPFGGGPELSFGEDGSFILVKDSGRTLAEDRSLSQAVLAQLQEIRQTYTMTAKEIAELLAWAAIEPSDRTLPNEDLISVSRTDSGFEVKQTYDHPSMKGIGSIFEFSRDGELMSKRTLNGTPQVLDASQEGRYHRLSAKALIAGLKLLSENPGITAK